MGKEQFFCRIINKYHEWDKIEHLHIKYPIHALKYIENLIIRSNSCENARRKHGKTISGQNPDSTGSDCRRCRMENGGVQGWISGEFV